MKYSGGDNQTIALPLANVCPRSHHVVVDLGDLVCVVISVQGQQIVSKGIGFIHLTLPLLQLLHEDLEGRNPG